MKQLSDDYMVTIRVSYGAAIAFERVLALLLENDMTTDNSQFAAQVEKDMVSIRRQLKTQGPKAMATMREKR